MKKEFTFIWGQRFCLIVNYKCVCWGGGGGGGGGGVDTGNCRFAAAVIILNEITSALFLSFFPSQYMHYP